MAPGSFPGELEQMILLAVLRLGNEAWALAIIKELDKNADGKADLAEFKQPTVEGFKHMDADGDGFATSDEVEAFFGEMRERLRQMQQKGEQQPAQ